MEKSIFFDLSFYSYFLAVFAYAAWFFKKNKALEYFCTALLVVGASLHLGFIIQRWIIAQYPPFSNTFETLVFFSWVLVVQYLIMELVFHYRFLGAGVSFIALLILAYSTFFPSAVRPLMPALRNNFWLTVHVILCFISYAAFTLSFLAAIFHLIQKRSWHQWIALFLVCLLLSGLTTGAGAVYLHKAGKVNIEWNLPVVVQFIFGILVFSSLLWFPSFLYVSQKEWKTTEDTLKKLIHGSITFGFPFLTMGILSGAVWANEAWGNYWSWDPKETWSLITWLIYAIYLHIRYKGGWQGTQMSWLSVIGFLSVLFTYFGVNYLLSGLHSYA